MEIKNTFFLKSERRVEDTLKRVRKVRERFESVTKRWPSKLTFQCFNAYINSI